MKLWVNKLFRIEWDFNPTGVCWTSIKIHVKRYIGQKDGQIQYTGQESDDLRTNLYFLKFKIQTTEI